MSMQLSNYSDIVISISGGKDSQTILGVVMERVKQQSFGGTVFAVHGDTGAEWPESLPHCQLLCAHYSIPLQVARPKRPLPQHIAARCHRLQQEGRKGGWPSPSCRYCTSDCKRDPIHAVIRDMFPCYKDARILSVTGERRQESRHRAKLPELDDNRRLTANRRVIENWRPILDYTLADVWAHIAATGLPRHIAYDLGNERLSCAICMLASDGDIRRGAAHCPELAERYLRIEQETGHAFRSKKSLKEILAQDNTH